MSKKIIVVFLCLVSCNVWATIDQECLAQLGIFPAGGAINELEMIYEKLSKAQNSELEQYLDQELIFRLQQVKYNLDALHSKYIEKITKYYLDEGLTESTLSEKRTFRLEFLRCMRFILASEALIYAYKIIALFDKSFQDKVKQNSVWKSLMKIIDDFKVDNESYGGRLENLCKNGLFNNALYYSCVIGAYETMESLLTRGIDPNNCVHKFFGYSPLLWPVIRNDVKAVECLAMHGAKIDLQDKNGDTVLHWGAKLCNYDVVQCLLRLGASNGIINKLHETPAWARTVVFVIKRRFYLVRSFAYQIKICEVCESGEHVELIKIFDPSSKDEQVQKGLSSVL